MTKRKSKYPKGPKGVPESMAAPMWWKEVAVLMRYSLDFQELDPATVMRALRSAPDARWVNDTLLVWVNDTEGRPVPAGLTKTFNRDTGRDKVLYPQAVRGWSVWLVPEFNCGEHDHAAMGVIVVEDDDLDGDWVEHEVDPAKVWELLEQLDLHDAIAGPW